MAEDERKKEEVTNSGQEVSEASSAEKGAIAKW